MAKFDLAGVMGLDVSKLDTGGIQKIELALIDPNPKNFFAVEDDITDLAESIAVNGLLQPLVVTPAEGGRYRVIAGHRRQMALLSLAAESPDKWARVDCKVLKPTSSEAEMLALIQTNTEARVISYAERCVAVEAVEKILMKLQQEQGVKLPGKMRATVAKILKTSESQIARAKVIESKLIPEFKQSALTDSAAYELAKLPAAQQSELYRRHAAQPCEIDVATVRAYKAERVNPTPAEKAPPDIDTSAEALQDTPAAAAPTGGLRWYRSLSYDYTPRDGELCLLVLSDNLFPTIVRCTPCRWKNRRFVLASNQKVRPIENMVCFCPLPELPDGFTFEISP